MFIVSKRSWLWRSYRNILVRYLGGRAISTDVFFILENLRINCQMDAGEFEGLLYNILSEDPFKNKILDMIYEKDDYAIYYYFSRDFGILIGESWTFLTFHATTKNQTIKRWLIYYAIGINITQRKINTNWSWKKTHLGKSCVAMIDLMVKFDGKWSWVMLHMKNTLSQAIK